MHTQLENWFRDGVAPDDTLPGIMAQALLTKWPAPNEVDSIEVHLNVATDVAHYHGYMDIGYELPAPAVTGIAADGKRHLRVVGDHKSTSNLKWAKDEETLRTDPQTIIYSGAQMALHGVDTIVIRWVYVTRDKKPRTRVVEFLFTQAEAEAGFDLLDVDAAAILEARNRPGIVAMDLPPNVESCNAYGGCQHKTRCTDLTPEKRLRALMAQMTLRERILAGKNKTAAAADTKVEEKKPATAAVAKTSVAAKTPASAAPAMTLKERMAAKKAGKGGAVAETAAETEVETETVEEEAAPATSAVSVAKSKPKVSNAKTTPASTASVDKTEYVCRVLGTRLSGTTLLIEYEVAELGHVFEKAYKLTPQT